MLRTDARKILAAALVNLMKKHTIDEITVEKITAKASCSRTTFYRYFQDKYDLMNWIYADKFHQIVKAYPGPKNRDNVIRATLIFLKENQEYFQSVMKYRGQNSFDIFVEKLIMEYYLNEVMQVSSLDELPKDVSFALSVFVCGLLRTGFIWLEKDEGTEDIDLLMQYSRESVPQILVPYLKE